MQFRLPSGTDKPDVGVLVEIDNTVPDGYYQQCSPGRFAGTDRIGEVSQWIGVGLDSIFLMNIDTYNNLHQDCVNYLEQFN